MKTQIELMLEEARTENRRLRRFVDFVNLWCWRDSDISDTERLSMIKYHPLAKEYRNKRQGVS